MIPFEYSDFKARYISKDPGQYHFLNDEAPELVHFIMFHAVRWADQNFRSWNPLRSLPSLFITVFFFGLYTWAWVFMNILEGLFSLKE